MFLSACKPFFMYLFDSFEWNKIIRIQTQTQNILCTCAICAGDEAGLQDYIGAEKWCSRLWRISFSSSACSANQRPLPLDQHEPPYFLGRGSRCQLTLRLLAGDMSCHQPQIQSQKLCQLVSAATNSWKCSSCLLPNTSASADATVTQAPPCCLGLVQTAVSRATPSFYITT